MITHLVDPAALAGDRVELMGDGYRHLFRARRLAAGVRLRLVDGRGGARWGEVVEVDRRRARVVLGEAAPVHEPAYRLALWIAAPRPQRASWLVEKATELGAAAIRFLGCARAPRVYGAGTLERLRRVASSALEQSHGARLPEIEGVVPWDDALARLGRRPAGAQDRFVLHPGAGGSFAPAGDHPREGVVTVGPEGGWRERELAGLRELGFRTVELGPRVLRTETAAIVAAAHLLTRDAAGAC